MSVDERLDEYYNKRGYESVPSACGPHLFPVFVGLNRIQVEKEIHGNIAEIGVHHGRLLIFLALLMRSTERALAIDVFDVDTNYDPTGGTTTLAIVKENYKKFVGNPDDLLVIVGDSFLITPAKVRALLGADGVRMFSIDGAHSHFHTVSDMLLAEALMPPGGIVMVDDIAHTGWPGVMEGVARYFLNTPCQRLFPFMIGYNKLWLTTFDYHQIYFDYALNDLRRELPKRVTRFFGTDVVGF